MCLCHNLTQEHQTGGAGPQKVGTSRTGVQTGQRQTHGEKSNLRQQLQDGSGVERTDGKGDEKAENVFHELGLQQRNDEDSGEGEDTDQRHTQEGKTPNWSWTKRSVREE